MRRVPGRTTTVAKEEAVPPFAVAVTVASPRTRPARKTTLSGRVLTSFPDVGGARAQVTPAPTRLPNASVAAALNVASPRARISRDAGITRTRAVGPATTVTSRVA